MGHQISNLMSGKLKRQVESMNSERFFVVSPERKFGPFTPEELRQLNRNSPLDPAWTLMGEQNGEHRPISDVIPGEAAVNEVISRNFVQPEKNLIQHPGADKDYSNEPAVYKLGSLRRTTFRHVGIGVLFALIFLFHPMILRAQMTIFHSVLIPWDILIAGLCFMSDGYINWRRVRVMEDTPTSTAKSVSVGMVELCGKVISLNNLAAPYSKQSCVVCEYRKEVKGYKGRWRTVKHDTIAAPFLLEDDSGTIVINPDKAWVDFKTELGDWDFQAYSDSRTRLSERWIAPGEFAYVLGRAEIDRSDGGLEDWIVRKDPHQDFIILRGSENKVMKRLKSIYIADWVIAVILTGGAVFFWRYVQNIMALPY